MIKMTDWIQDWDEIRGLPSWDCTTSSCASIGDDKTTKSTYTYEFLVHPIIYNSFESESSKLKYCKRMCYKTYYTTNNITTDAIYFNCEKLIKRRTPQQKLQDIIKTRQSPAIHTRRNPLHHVEDRREQRARQTLKQIVGEKQYRDYLRFGFISVRGKSGLVYQLPGNNSHMIKVFRNGQLIENLCVYLKGKFPPTDQIIVEYLMALNNEQEFRSLANISKASEHFRISTRYSIRPKLDTRPLSEIFRELKEAA